MVITNKNLDYTMSGTEAEARIKINKMLEEAGWRLCDNENGRKNVDLETSTKVRRNEQERKGAIDYLLLDSHNYPICVLEAKKDSINPLSAKDQARAYPDIYQRNETRRANPDDVSLLA